MASPSPSDVASTAERRTARGRSGRSSDLCGSSLSLSLTPPRAVHVRPPLARPPAVSASALASVPNGLSTSESALVCALSLSPGSHLRVHARRRSFSALAVPLAPASSSPIPRSGTPTCFVHTTPPASRPTQPTAIAALGCVPLSISSNRTLSFVWRASSSLRDLPRASAPIRYLSTYLRSAPFRAQSLMGTGKHQYSRQDAEQPTSSQPVQPAAPF
ncbi:hypothetical protein BV20DRAFT_1052365 [Pilatotrama ljubarskyi]|nr:hypothetical protein BV20DRAFT_1052365 [Pilatotrama ljubarskyi]